MCLFQGEYLKGVCERPSSLRWGNLGKIFPSARSSLDKVFVCKHMGPLPIGPTLAASLVLFSTSSTNAGTRSN